MPKNLRVLFFLIGAVQIFFAIVFFLQWPFAIRLWPFEGTTPLTFIFISSIFAAAAAPTLWVAWTERYEAFAGIGLDYLAILTPLAIFAFQRGASTGNASLTTYGILCALGALFGIGLFLWSIRIPMTKQPAMPKPVRWSFVFFMGVLLIVSVQLILKVPNIIPWTITPDLSVVIGWMFMGAAFYFAYGLLRPSWFNSAGQLVSFLAYDGVLIVPFLTRLPTVAPEFRLNLIIYTAVVTYSAGLAIYYLFIRPPARL